MKKDGFSPELIHACHNRTVVIDAHLGEAENKQLPVVQAHGLRNIHLYEGDEPWIHIRDAVGDLAETIALAVSSHSPNAAAIFVCGGGAYNGHLMRRLQQAVMDNGNVFEVLMEAVRVCSLGQVTSALFEVGGQYRRNM